MTDDERPLGEESNLAWAQFVAMQPPSAAVAAWLAALEQERTDGAVVVRVCCMRCGWNCTRDEALAWGRLEAGSFICGMTFPTCRSAPAPMTAR